MRVIRIGERYSISTDEVETYDLLAVRTYVVMYNDKDALMCIYILKMGRCYIDITIAQIYMRKEAARRLQCKQNKVLLLSMCKFEKHYLHYDKEKGVVVIPGDSLLLDYDDYENDIKIESL